MHTPVMGLMYSIVNHEDNVRMASESTVIISYSFEIIDVLLSESSLEAPFPVVKRVDSTAESKLN